MRFVFYIFTGLVIGETVCRGITDERLLILSVALSAGAIIEQLKEKKNDRH